MAKKANISGLIVFFVGIALLLVTFIVALLAFINPDRVGGFGDLIPAPEGDWEGVVVALGYWWLWGCSWCWVGWLARSRPWGLGCSRPVLQAKQTWNARRAGERGRLALLTIQGPILEYGTGKTQFTGLSLERCGVPHAELEELGGG